MASAIARTIVAISAMALFAGAARAQIDQPSLVPSGIDASTARALASARAARMTQLNALLVRLGAHNGRCERVRAADTATIAACQTSGAAVMADLAAYRTALAAYESQVRAAPTFLHTGNGLVGGMGARFGFYSPVGASAEVRARALQSLRDQDRARGERYADQIDVERYNFAIGVANDTRVWDFGTRVLQEQLANGQFTASPNQQAAYDRLRGRQFDELGCHSNGAMTCLAALINGDAQATNVVLYGPQITPESLRMWEQLLTSRRIHSLEILVAQNDVVTPLALLVSPRPTSSEAAATLGAPILHNVDDLARAIRTMTPGAVVRTFACGTIPGTQCHDLERYSDYRRHCPSAPNRAAVPGTRITGNPNSRSLREPPNPVCG